jgi:molybdenum cofactor cytidylyltransferase
MNLIQALRLSSVPKVVLVGSGGKTSAMFRIARQLPRPVLVTTSTHLAIEQSDLADQHYYIRTTEDLKKLSLDPSQGVILLTGYPTGGSRLSGLNPAIMKSLIDLVDDQNLGLLVEADGAQMRPLKASGDHEPAIFPELWMRELPDRKQINEETTRPRSSLDAVIVVAGLSGLGKPLTADWVHRPQEFSHLSGLQRGEIISIAGLKKFLINPQGGLKNIPPKSRRIALLNQVDRLVDKSQAGKLAEGLIPAYDSVLLGSLLEKVKGKIIEIGESASIYSRDITAVYEPVAGVILAAGGSKRMGEPKQLLNWRGQTLIRHVIKNAIKAKLSPIIVVLGAYHERIKQEIVDLPVKVVKNDDWRKGQSCSVRAGLDAITDEIGAAVFLLADQPMISSSILQALVKLHAETLAAIVAPRVHGQRGNPVLFDRATFPDLRNIHGDMGGRALFASYEIAHLDVDDPQILYDIDTIDDYKELISPSE